jgi:adenine phosphoribosyltransferase
MEDIDYWRPEFLKYLLVDVPDFPIPGVLFRDITPILESPLALKSLQHQMNILVPHTITKIVATESRGFIIGSLLAASRHVGLVLARKPGKLPRETYQAKYGLEYGTDCLAIHKTSLSSQDKVVIVDDVLATGGTARAVEQLCEQAGCTVLGHRFFIELEALEGRKKLTAPVASVLKL